MRRVDNISMIRTAICMVIVRLDKLDRSAARVKAAELMMQAQKILEREDFNVPMDPVTHEDDPRFDAAVDAWQSRGA